MANLYGPRIVTNGLVLCLDAGNNKSYPGSGSTWYDLSGNNYHFTINSSAYAVSNGIKYMDFEGSYGSAKRVVNGVLTDVPNFTNGTIIVFSSIKNSTADWRTLTRGASNDHQVLIQTGTNNLGMYDNNADAFITGNFNITSIPNVYTKFNFLCFRLSQSSPYWQFQYNNDTTIYSITNVNASFNNGFCVIGAWHQNSTNVSTNQQYWGKIAYFAYYNRQLSQTEIAQNYNAIKGRFV